MTLWLVVSPTHRGEKDHRLGAGGGRARGLVRLVQEQAFPHDDANHWCSSYAQPTRLITSTTSIYFGTTFKCTKIACFKFQRTARAQWGPGAGVVALHWQTVRYTAATARQNCPHRGAYTCKRMPRGAG